MGFSDSFKKAISQIGELGSINSKNNNSGSGSLSRMKSGRMNSRDWLSVVASGGGVPGNDRLNSQKTFMRNPNQDNLNAGLSAQWKEGRALGYGANAGHQVGQGLFGDGDKTDAPPVTGRPAIEDVSKAKRQAKQRALNAASRRRGLGLSGTIKTSALGLSGSGTVSSRNLIGE